MTENHDEHQQPEGHNPDAAQQELERLAAEAEAATTAQPAAEPEDEPVIRQRSRQQLLSWHAVGAIVAFVQRFNAGDEDVRRAAMETFGFSFEDFDAVDLAQGLYPSGGAIEAFTTFSGVATKAYTGTLGFMDGAKLVGQLTDMDPDVIKTFVRISNEFAGTDIKYRRGNSLNDIVETIVNTLFTQPDADKQRTLGTLQWIESLLELWPGDNA